MNATTQETTFTAAAGRGQDAPNVAGPGNASPSAAERLASARQGHADAVENHRQATERAGRAAGQHRAAEAEYQGLIATAANGSEISAGDINRAKAKVSEAIDAADHARLVAAGALAITERAAIEVMHREAEHHRGAHAAALMVQIAAAERIDSAFASLQAEIDAHDAARFEVMAASNACRLHRQAVIDAARTNETLRKMEPSQRPRSHAPEMPTVPPVRIGFFAQAFGETMIVKSYSVAAALRAALGIPAPKAGS